jgi:hypothetical protein
MPMIDIYAAAGTFTETHKLATDAAALIKAVEGVPDIAMFRKNTAAFIHEGLRRRIMEKGATPVDNHFMDRVPDSLAVAQYHIEW